MTTRSFDATAAPARGPGVAPAPLVPPSRSGGLPVLQAAVVLVDAGTTVRDTPITGEADEVLPGAVVAALVAAQVCPDDVVALARLTGYDPCLAEAASWFDEISRSYPAMGVRDAFGWSLQVARSTQPYTWVKDVIGPWQRVGLAEQGWLYAAAGFTPAESRAGRDAGTLTEEDARALAALRGAPLPA